MNAPFYNGLVSVIIPVFERPRLIVEAVDSVLQQTYRPIELILVDDGSNDETPLVLAGLARRHPAMIRVLTTCNQGPGLAREAGRLAAKGEFIQYLDSDDLLLPEKFAVQVAALRRHPDCDIAYGQTRLVDDHNRVIEEPYRATGHELPFLFPLLMSVRWWSTHTPLYRRSLCDAIGPWSDLRMNEDWEYEARAGALRVKLSYSPRVLSATRWHGEGRLTSASDSTERVLDMTRLLKTLLLCACQAGVDPKGEQMGRFVTWALYHSERARIMGLKEDAAECLHIARVAARLTKGDPL